MTNADHLATSDKVTWHRYLDFYEPFFARLAGARRVLEYGVFQGASIRYLADRFTEAAIIGCDILPVQETWPSADRITYAELDQGQPADLMRLFDEHPGPYDLVIEDGSHVPEHQRNCLVATLPHIRGGGVYILEDLHTSHPDHSTMTRRGRRTANSYHLLLAMEHMLSVGLDLNEELVRSLSDRSYFTAEDVRLVFAHVSEVALYRRSTLPVSCYRCGSVEFDYRAMKCVCGVPLAETADSMAAVLVVKRDVSPQA